MKSLRIGFCSVLGMDPKPEYDTYLYIIMKILREKGETKRLYKKLYKSVQVQFEKKLLDSIFIKYTNT